jgi:hypothetical protein
MMRTVVVLAVLLLGMGMVRAQETIEHLAVQTLNGQITVYTISAAGVITPLNEVNQTINTALINLSPAFLQSPSDIAIAPDGTRIALVASTYPNPVTTAVLLVYSLQSNSLVTAQLPGYGSLQWSPASDAVLLYPSPAVGDFTRLSDLYIYDLAQATLRQVTNTPLEPLERNVLWIPGTNQIVFSTGLQDCTTAACVATANLFSVRSDGTRVIQLTQLDEFLPVEAIPYGYCSIKNPAWNAEHERVLYIMSCDDADREILFSVSLNGDNQIELNLPEFFSTSDTVIYSHVQIQGIHTDPIDHQIIVVTTEEHQPIDQLMVEKSLHIFELIDSAASSVFSLDISPAETVSTSSLRASEGVLALSTFALGPTGGGVLRVVDLNTQQVTTKETANRVCNLSWLDQTFIVYDQLFEGFCGSATNAVWIWDIQTDSVTETEITGSVQIVALPNAVASITPTPTFTPTTTSTPTFTAQQAGGAGVGRERDSAAGGDRELRGSRGTGLMQIRN